MPADHSTRPVHLASVVAYDPTDLRREQKRTDRRWAVDAKKAAQRVGAQDALLVSPEGLLGETTSANVFIVLPGGAVVTPPVRGIVPGVVRAWVLERGGATERAVTLEDLETAQEIFLTTAGRGVVPVSGVGVRVFSRHALASDLRAAWQALPLVPL
jgi:branched-subunit amino acid aminotransferase/4-amino-4-deoxychorismate lyase